MSEVKSPLKYHGGKSYLAKRIIDLMPDRESWHLYREPYFGGGSVLFTLDPEGISEAVNDIDGELTNFWRCLSNSVSCEVFTRIIEAVPFCDDAFNKSVDTLIVDAPYLNGSQKAAAFFIRNRQSRQGLGKDFATPTTRLRRGMNENVSAWLSAVEGLPEVHERLKRVEVRNMDAIDFIRKYDHEKAVFYCDPPYLHETREAKDAYRHEMTRDQHAELLAHLGHIEGRFLLSGYRHEMYDNASSGFKWRRVDIKQPKHSSGKKSKELAKECVWMNY